MQVFNFNAYHTWLPYKLWTLWDSCWRYIFSPLAVICHAIEEHVGNQWLSHQSLDISLDKCDLYSPYSCHLNTPLYHWYWPYQSVISADMWLVPVISAPAGHTGLISHAPCSVAVWWYQFGIIVSICPCQFPDCTTQIIPRCPDSITVSYINSLYQCQIVL